jgi:hypothetical protein
MLLNFLFQLILLSLLYKDTDSDPRTLRNEEKFNLFLPVVKFAEGKRAKLVDRCGTGPDLGKLYRSERSRSATLPEIVTGVLEIIYGSYQRISDNLLKTFAAALPRNM